VEDVHARPQTSITILTACFRTCAVRVIGGARASCLLRGLFYSWRAQIPILFTPLNRGMCMSTDCKPINNC
jgi:hypothetical protein